MADSFQHEIPKGRVNITLDVETAEGRKKKELPLKLLVLGDFSQGKTKNAVAERDRLSINKSNFDKVMKELSPELNYTVTNRIRGDGSMLKVKLQLDAIKKFHPEELIQQIPELRQLLAMRNLLKDLKANVIDNATFRRELEKIVKDRTNLQQLRDHLNTLMIKEE